MTHGERGGLTARQHRGGHGRGRTTAYTRDAGICTLATVALPLRRTVTIAAAARKNINDILTSGLRAIRLTPGASQVAATAGVAAQMGAVNVAGCYASHAPPHSLASGQQTPRRTRITNCGVTISPGTGGRTAQHTRSIHLPTPTDATRSPPHHSYHGGRSHISAAIVDCRHLQGDCTIARYTDVSERRLGLSDVTGKCGNGKTFAMPRYLQHNLPLKTG